MSFLRPWWWWLVGDAALPKRHRWVLHEGAAAVAKDSEQRWRPGCLISALLLATARRFCCVC